MFIFYLFYYFINIAFDVIYEHNFKKQPPVYKNQFCLIINKWKSKQPEIMRPSSASRSLRLL